MITLDVIEEISSDFLPCRAINALRDLELKTLDDVSRLTSRKLKTIRGCGDYTVSQIAAAFDTEGIPHSIKSDWTPAQKKRYYRFFIGPGGARAIRDYERSNGGR